MLSKILTLAQEAIKQSHNLDTLQQLKSQFLGKQSTLSIEMQKLPFLSSDERKKTGIELNNARSQIQKMIEHRSLEIETKSDERLLNEKLDLTIPAPLFYEGSIHPLTQALEEMKEILAQFGFALNEGPSIETDWYNFTALNIGKNHPARQMHDTFYLKGNESLLLRTHTSPVQIREMEKHSLPIRIISSGRAYRCDSDMTHTPTFHQIEGLVVDKKINMGHLKYVIINFLKNFFERNDIEIRFRPSYFPFTEPSAEVDIKISASKKWLEVLGCGMVHPVVFQNVGIDSSIYKGFAFGLGIERLAMLKYGIQDLRQFYEGDIRWLNHYSFSAFDIPSLTKGLTE